MKKLFKNKKYIIIFIILILVIGGCIFLLKRNNSGDKVLKKETYVAYVKINPLVKLTFDSSYYECGNELCNYTTEVTKIDLLNEDANIYGSLNIENKSLSDVIASLIIIADNNSLNVNNVNITTNLNYNLDSINNSIKEKIKDVKTEVEIKFNYESEINEEKIIDNEIVSYTVSFDSDGGSVVSNQNILENNNVSKPVNPKKDGYTFIEWQLDGKTYDFNSKVNKDIILKALWKKIENTNTSKEENKTEEKKCTSKKFDKKYSYAYDTKEICIKEGNNAFNDITDNVDSSVFSYSCKKIIDECGKTWYGVVFYKWQEELGEYEINY